MKKQNWAMLFIALIGAVLSFSPYINKYDILGWLSFGMIFTIIPYSIYKALPANQLSLLLALGSPIIVGFSYGYWLEFYENYLLTDTGIRTKGVVIATWLSRTRQGGNEKLFRVRFKANSKFQTGFSHENKLNYQIGDSVLVEYLPSEPNTYRIIH